MTPSKPPTSLTKLLLLPLLSLITCSNANTEKTIFTAPLPISLSSSKLPPLLHDIPVLGPSTQLSIRTNLTRVFPTQHRDANEEGTEGNENEEPGSPSWLLLDHLTPGQRYELRVCWSALEPTSFTLDTYPLSTVLSTPSLLTSLTHHAGSLSRSKQQQQQNQQFTVDDNSVLLLRVLAAADYFSHHASLMRDPPPVLVDLILDPYLYNVLPQSLVPTVCYVVAVGILSWFVARWAARSLASVASENNDRTKKQN